MTLVSAYICEDVELVSVTNDFKFEAPDVVCVKNFFEKKKMFTFVSDWFVQSCGLGCPRLEKG